MNKIKRRKRKKNHHIIIILVFFIGILLIFPAYAYMRQNLNVKGNTSILDSSLTEECSAAVTYEINSWNNNNINYYRMVFTLKNEGNKDYNYWDVYFDVPTDAEIVASSSTDASIVGSRVKASNVSYNANVMAGNSTTFEIQLTTNEVNFKPDNISANNCYTKVDSDNRPNIKDNIEVSFVVVASYGNYTYQYDVFVKNIGTDTLDNWNFTIEKPNNTSLTNAWNTNYIIKDNSIEFSNSSYNGTIQPGGSVNFGIIMNTDIFGYIPKLQG